MIGGVALAGVVIPAPAREADVNERTDTGTMDPHGRGDETPALTTCVRFTPSRPTPRHDQNPADFRTDTGRSRDWPGPVRVGPGLRNASPARRSPPRLAPCEPSATQSACARFSRAHLAQCDLR